MSMHAGCSTWLSLPLLINDCNCPTIFVQLIMRLWHGQPLYFFTVEFAVIQYPLQDCTVLSHVWFAIVHQTTTLCQNLIITSCI